eukprot:TRINITY_DN9661_c0_g1_i1.p1 TRINITY_DN9661_c0_g1~~TRINITY_DN9661_c0_g1_i1.p1  ORF type:complete len:263 (-),score=25.26 TRINITY_DN9661_c0_g1_i1:5-793(-)
MLSSLKNKLEFLSIEYCKELTILCAQYIPSICTSIRQLQLYGALVISDHFICNLSTNCTMIDTLILENCSKVTEKGLMSLGNCHKLKCLAMAKCPNLTNGALISIAKNCPQLITLNINGKSRSELFPGIKERGAKYTGVNDEGISQLAKYCPKLEMLDIFEGCTNKISDKGLIDLATHCTELKSLKLISLFKITDESFKALGQNCRKLAALEASTCSQITEAGIRFILDHCKDLKQVILRNFQTLTPEKLEEIKKTYYWISW